MQMVWSKLFSHNSDVQFFRFRIQIGAYEFAYALISKNTPAIRRCELVVEIALAYRMAVFSYFKFHCFSARSALSRSR